jgi:ligand-binding sensor domain-containing protein
LERNHLRRLIFSLLAMASLASSGMAALRNPLAWELFLPIDQWALLQPWGQELVAADEDGGLLLYRPDLDTSRMLTTREGLPSNRIVSMLVDATGSLWIGTVDAGAARIGPGGDVRLISGLVDLHVQALAADGAFIVYGTPNGAGPVVGGSTGLPYTTDDGLASNDVRALAAYAGQVWFGGPSGVTQFDRAANSFDIRNGGLNTAAELDIAWLHASSDGVVAATGRGAFIYDAQLQSWLPLGANLAADLRRVRRIGPLWYAVRSDDTVWTLSGSSGDWIRLDLDNSARDFYDVAADLAGGIWISGTRRDLAAMDAGRRGLLSNEQQSIELVRDGVSRAWVQGISSDRAGGFWLGNAAPSGIVNHIQADGTIVSYDRLDTGNDDGLCHGSFKIALQTTLSGDVWVSSFEQCQSRILPDPSDDPLLAGYESYFPQDGSPLQSRYVDRIDIDERGRLWFASSGRGSDTLLNQGVDVLVDPSTPNSPSSWLKLAPTTSQLARGTVSDVAAGPDGVVWFALDGYGLQRWDSDGLANDGSLDSYDDSFYWSTIDGSALGGFVDLLQPRALAIGEDGSVWVGTVDEGLIHFRFTSFATEVEVYEQAGLSGGMLSSTVLDVVVDRRGDAWVATDAGLNRVRRDPAGDSIDAWTTLSAFETRQLAVHGFSTEVLSPLPSPSCNRLDYDAERDLIFLSTSGGAVRIHAGGLAPIVDPNITLRVFPNPARLSTQSVYVSGFEGVATVKIFDMQGNPISEISGIRAGLDPVWNLADRMGSPVASGLYIVQVIRGDSAVEAILAVEK